MDDHELAVAAVVAISRAYGAWGCDQDALATAADEAVAAIGELADDYPAGDDKARATLERLAALR